MGTIKLETIIIIINIIIGYVLALKTQRRCISTRRRSHCSTS